MNTMIELRNIFREIFDDDLMSISQGTMRSNLDDWDSISHIKLVLTIEEKFEIRMTTDEVASLNSVNDFLDIVKKNN